MNKRTGSATLLALMTMLIFSLIIAGLVPMMNQELKAVTADHSVLQARYAAEAGIKHAYLSLQATNKIDGNTFYQSLAMGQVGNKTAQYYLYLTHQNSSTQLAASTALVPGATYTITATGTYNGATQTVAEDFIASGGGGTPADVIWQPPGTADYANTTKYAALTDGTLTAWSGNAVVNNTYGTDYALATTKKIDPKSYRVQIPASDQVKNVDLKFLEATFFKPSNPLFAAYTRRAMGADINPDWQYGSSWGNLWTNSRIAFPTGYSFYEVSGDIVINAPLTLAEGSRIIIYSNKNIIVNRPLSGHIALIAEGDIQLDAACTGHLEFYAKKDMRIYRSVTGYGLFMSLQNLYVTAGVYDKAFLFGDNSVGLSGAQVTGAVYSRGTMTLDGATSITYDASAIPTS